MGGDAVKPGTLTVFSLFFFFGSLTILLTVQPAVVSSAIAVDRVGSSPEKNDNDNDNDKAASASMVGIRPQANWKPVREEALLQLADYVRRGDAGLKENLQDSYSDLKQRLQQGDTLLKDSMSAADDQMREQLRRGDSRLKEELDADVTFLKDAMTSLDAKVTQQLTEQAQAMKALQDSSAQAQPNSALTDDLQDRVSGLRADLDSAKHLMETTHLTLQTLQTALQTSQSTVRALSEQVTDLQAQLTSGQLLLQDQPQPQPRPQAEEEEEEEDRLQKGGPSECGQCGSTFIRWGSASCPNETSLVYSGVAGGSAYFNRGGASDYLCLVMNPELDNDTAKEGRYNELWGAELDHMEPHDHDVLCSVCRAPQATTLMIAATVTCPAGWTFQYSGHLASAAHDHQGRTQHVCLDDAREVREGGEGNASGAMFVHVFTRCGSLPCGPYRGNTAVTCVVCSL